ncbi:MAG TPA: hypothetical protein VFD58_20595 [Blastocatellia bacterium]|nr:hypothetical protein [Blastocatellia bacterium]
MKATPQASAVDHRPKAQRQTARVCGSDFIGRIATYLMIATLLALPALSPAWAQRSPGSKKTRTASVHSLGKSQARPVTQAVGNEQSCDGALEVVPRRQMTFIRKRHPVSGSEK